MILSKFMNIKLDSLHIRPSCKSDLIPGLVFAGET